MLDDKTKQEFDELDSMDEFEAQYQETEEPATKEGYNPGQTHYIDPETKKTVEIPQEQQVPVGEGEIPMADVVATSIMESVPFAKDAVALAETTKNGQDFTSEAYSAQMQKLNGLINRSEEQNPVAFTATDIGFGLLLPGAKTLKGMMAFGALSSLSRSEERSASDLIVGASLAGSLGYVGKKISSSVASRLNKASKNIGIVADEGMKDVVDGAKHRSKLNKHIDKFFSGTQEEKAEAYAKYILTRGIGEETDTVQTTVNKFNNMKDEAAKKIQNLIEKNDRPLSEDEVKKVYDQIFKNLELDNSLPSQSYTEKISALKEKLKNEFFEVKPPRIEVEEVVDPHNLTAPAKKITKTIKEPPTLKKFTLKDLHQTKVYYGQEASKSFDKASKAYDLDSADFFKNANLAIGDAITSVLPEMAEANKQYAIGKMGQELSQNVLDGINGGPINKLKNIFNIRSTVAVLASAGALGGGDAGTAAVSGVIAKVAAEANNPNVHPKLAQKLYKLSNHLKTNPDSPVFQKLLVGAGMTMDDFRDKLSGSISEINLMEQGKLPRTVDAVMQNADDILQYMQSENKAAAAELRNAVEQENKEKIGMIMDSMLKTPAAKRYFEDGVGFNGKLYDPQDIKNAEHQISTMDISLKQKLQLYKNLREQSIAPQPQQEPDRFLELNKKDKSKPNY